MPLQSATTLPIIAGFMPSGMCLGVSSQQLALGISLGLSYYAPLIRVVTADVGTVGSGAGTGAVILTPASVIPSISSLFAAQGIIGVTSQPLAIAVGNALSSCFSTAIPITVHPSVGVGTGIGTLIPASGAGPFSAGFASAGIIGKMGANLAIAIANGLDAALPSSIVNVIITGPAGPSPSSGAGTGTVI